MNTKPFNTTEIINLFMIDRLVSFFIRKNTTPNQDADVHKHYELYFVGSGQLTMLSGNRLYTVQAGQCFITPPRTLHQVQQTAEETTLFLAGFSSASELLLPLCERSFDLNEDEQTLLCEIVEDGRLCFEVLPDQSHEIGYRVREGITRGRLQALKNKLEIFLIKLIESRAADSLPTRHASVADAVYRYLSAHVTDRVTLEQIAQSLSLSVPYIKRRFHEQYRCGIIDTLIDMKLERAKLLMRETSLNFTQIADYLSFESENHFSKTFKKRTGKTPREWSTQHE